MFELKKISRQGIPAALAKAERYRLINQPRMAESICLDILEVEPSHEEALAMLLLCLTDQFWRPGYGVGLKEARDLLSRFPEGYLRDYYEGVISERWGKSLLTGHSSANAAVDWIRQAMTQFEKALAKSPPGNDEAILHWNACARLITRLEASGSISAEDEGGFRDDVPPY
ncbi:MAG TPA: hypothetical protein VGR38_06475 [Candidatus Polarisedimenticolia bacterium]|jgi:hypothetical protein|nr:hypothetical protein [Candidatus Polarisedimenticolia bacterium]